MNKLIVICGPTATGKTKLALKLAKKFNGEILSADSRQVYKRMDIGTGKDLPNAAKFNVSVNLKQKGFDIGYYLMNSVRLWGYDFVDPKKEFSVSQYTDLAVKVINNIYKRKKLPILVGGTGFYIKSVVDGIETSNILPDYELRKSLETKSPDELFELLAANNPIKAASMNSSDKKNPRRLIRAIEVAKSRSEKGKLSKPLGETCNVLFIGLTADIEKLKQRVVARVKKRVELGIEKEIAKLLNDDVDWKMQSMKTLGYKEWQGYFYLGKSKELKNSAISEWINDETRYVKRQLTWFKKDKRIKWFNVYKKDFEERVEMLIEKWQN